MKLIKRDDLIRYLSDWALSISPLRCYYTEENFEIRHHEYKLLQEVIQCIKEFPAIDDKEAIQWIPCSERLPTRDDGDGVLVSTTKAFGGLVEVIYTWTSSVELYYQKGWVTAWMPLPKPYKED